MSYTQSHHFFTTKNHKPRTPLKISENLQKKRGLKNSICHCEKFINRESPIINICFFCVFCFHRKMTSPFRTFDASQVGSQKPFFVIFFYNKKIEF